MVQDAFLSEPVSVHFPVLPGKYRETSAWAPYETRLSSATHRLCGQIPYIAEQGIIFVNQGAFMQDQATRDDLKPLEDFELSDASLNEICSLLSVEQDDPRWPELRENLRLAASDYAINLSIAPLFGTPKQQRKAISRFIAAIDKAVTVYNDISPEYIPTIQGIATRSLNEPDRDSIDIDGALETLCAFSEAAERLLANYAPKKGAPPNLPLESAIRMLLPLVETVTGRRTEVSHAKLRPTGPKLISPEAQAIGLILRDVSPFRIDDTSIVNMIEKVRKQSEESESHLRDIFRADPWAELEMIRPPRPND